MPTTAVRLKRIGSSPTSPAVEAGNNAALPADTFDLDGDLNTAETIQVDQRGVGFPRNADSQDLNTTQTVDIGAYELHPSIEDIANQTTAEDTPKLVVFNLGDDTGALIATVTATSSNTALVIVTRASVVLRQALAHSRSRPTPTQTVSRTAALRRSP